MTREKDKASQERGRGGAKAARHSRDAVRGRRERAAEAADATGPATGAATSGGTAVGAADATATAAGAEATATAAGAADAAGGAAPTAAGAASGAASATPTPTAAAATPAPREFLKVREPILHRVVIAGALVVALLVAVVAAGVSAGIISGMSISDSGDSGGGALTTHGFLELTVRAEGWDEDATPAIARIRPAGSEEYLLCRAVPADARDIVELDEGWYYLSWITPVGADGTLYIPPTEEMVQVRAGHTTSRTAVFTRVPVYESTFSDYAATIDIVYEAMQYGDDTLSGDTGDALMRKLQQNANAAPNFFIYIPDE